MVKPHTPNPSVLVKLECGHVKLFRDILPGPTPDALPCFECRKFREDAPFRQVLDTVQSGPLDA